MLSSQPAKGINLAFNLIHLLHLRNLSCNPIGLHPHVKLSLQNQFLLCGVSPALRKPSGKPKKENFPVKFLLFKPCLLEWKDSFVYTCTMRYTIHWSRFSIMSCYVWRVDGGLLIHSGFDKPVFTSLNYITLTDIFLTPRCVTLKWKENFDDIVVHAIFTSNAFFRPTLKFCLAKFKFPKN